MTPDRFLEVVKQQRLLGDALLENRKASYSRGDDRLHNFKKAANLEGVSPEQALAGMMSKQIVALYDYIHDLERGVMIPRELWAEKITDSINYLYLLKGLLEERVE